VRLREPITRDDALRTQATFVHHTVRDQRFVSAEVPRMRISEKKKIGEYCYIDSPAALLALIGSGVVEWHVWNACVDDVERPDRIVLDLDPGPGVTWKRVVAAARAIRRELKRVSLESYVKTTGGKGLHVVAPLQMAASWEEAFELSRHLAADVCDASPDEYTLSFDKADRRGKVLIDYKRNHRTAIAVAAFSLRATPRATMSVPVSWSALGRLRGSDVWTIESLDAAVASS
jgi:bifunctional non-homologous end joining protein LigD